MVSDGTKNSCASCWLFISAVAIPVLSYMAMLCQTGSRMIEIPDSKKASAAVGLWVTVALYAATFIFCYGYKMSRSSSTEE